MLDERRWRSRRLPGLEAIGRSRASCWGLNFKHHGGTGRGAPSSRSRRRRRIGQTDQNLTFNRFSLCPSPRASGRRRLTPCG